MNCEHTEKLGRFLYETMMKRQEEAHKFITHNPFDGVRFTWDNETDECKADWLHLAQTFLDTSGTRLALQHCVNALKEYERKPGDDLKPFLLGALDSAQKALAGL